VGEVIPWKPGGQWTWIEHRGTSIPSDPLDVAVDRFVADARHEGIPLDRDQEIILRFLLWNLLDYTEGLHHDPTRA
jgi:hypothetical protein